MTNETLGSDKGGVASDYPLEGRWSVPSHIAPPIRYAERPYFKWIDSAFEKVDPKVYDDDLRTSHGFSNWLAETAVANNLPEGLRHHITKFAERVSVGARLMDRDSLSEDDFRRVNMWWKYRFVDRVADRVLSAVLLDRVGHQIDDSYHNADDQLARQMKTRIVEEKIEVEEARIFTGLGFRNLKEVKELTRAGTSMQLGITVSDIIKSWVENGLSGVPVVDPSIENQTSSG